MKKRIYIKNWLELKPYNNQALTDIYYLKLCNDVKEILMEPFNADLLVYLDENEINHLACFLVSYFEDIISDTNIWNTFKNYHTKLYNKKLPYYNTDEYFENEINDQDVTFLIWYFLNTVQEDKFISPFNGFISDIAFAVMLIFEDEYEYAPENILLKSTYSLNEDVNDYYEVRNFIDTILFKTYLFFPDTTFKLKQQEKEIIESKDENLLMFLQENRDSFLHKICTRLLSLKGKEWAAEILGNDHPLYSDLLNMSQRISGLFLYKGQDEEYIFIEHIASGKKFDLTKESFDHYSSLKEINKIVYFGIVQWQKEWWFSGINFQSDYNPNIILDEKNSLKSRMQVNFLDHNTEDTDSLLQKQLDAFLSFNNGSPIAFMKSEKINEFNKNYIEYFNNSLNLSKKALELAKNRAKNEGFFGGENNNDLDFTETSETGLFFFNPKSGGEIALAVNSAFPLKNNPFYNKKESENDILHLLMAENLSKELAMYCIDNCKTKLPFFKEGVGKQYLTDIDFLLRFWKTDNYHTKPSITFTGGGEK